MDIFYEGTQESSKKLLQAINKFGFRYLKITIDDLIDKDGYIKLGNNPVRIDLFCDLPGVEFNDVYNSAIEYKEENVDVKVIHVNHLIQNKQFVAWLQDLDDVKN